MPQKFRIHIFECLVAVTLLLITLCDAGPSRERHQAFCAGYGQRCDPSDDRVCCGQTVCSDGKCGSLNSRTGSDLFINGGGNNRKFKPSPIRSAEGR
ncbi:hypothetical protein BIW11_14298 [Tropilaelaps mercedesae]|uniref:Uncharacterized protein n=1 Tax=Tropilaelaps mercedesae TaxID=418985 RepID=A0A1V9WYB9_9ACAR|nr:hypothetical protein BIW11_14298 [Tropilaelaps mercedesae]